MRKMPIFRSLINKKAESRDQQAAGSSVDSRGQPFTHLLAEISDWQINHGSLLKQLPAERHDPLVQAVPIGVSLYPSPFPRHLHDEALKLQKPFNRLYCSVAGDEEWLSECVKDLLPVDRLVEALWNIHLTVKQQGFVQDVSLGIFRSDYMLAQDSTEAEALSLKQVEFNTFSVAGGVHSHKAAQLHRHLALTGAYEACPPKSSYSLDPSSLPVNKTIELLSSGLAAAHQAYGPSISENETAVLFIVDPYNVNIADERPLEYSLSQRDPAILAYRVEWGSPFLSQTQLTPTRELLFYPHCSSNTRPVEVSIAYLRSGLDPGQYDSVGYQCRLDIERSRAIKCPNILGHIAGSKKVQQCLTDPVAMARFFEPVSREDTDYRDHIVSAFVPMYPLDESDAGKQGRKLALDPRTAVNYVLKPSREGGGHNVYGQDIPQYLKRVEKRSWQSYILMEKIRHPPARAELMSPRGMYDGPVISELGVIGVCMWRSDTQGQTELLHNEQGGWSLKTKDESINEMSVVKGYGCFDSPVLVDEMPGL